MSVMYLLLEGKINVSLVPAARCTPTRLHRRRWWRKRVGR